MRQTIINLSKRSLPHGVRLMLRRLNWRRLYFSQTIFCASPEGGVYCTIAERPFKKFIDLRGDRIGPSNGSRSRQRLVWHYLKEEVGILKKPMRVLHVAPELAFMEILGRLQHLEYLPGDKMVEGYGDQKGVHNLDLTALDLPDARFDLVICNHVLEHIPDDRAAMREMYRVLAPGGQAVITVPVREDLQHTYEDPTITTPAQRRKHFGQWDHVRFYALDLKERLQEAGFQAVVVRYGRNFSKREYERLGLCDDPIFVARKP